MTPSLQAEDNLRHSGSACSARKALSLWTGGQAATRAQRQSETELQAILIIPWKCIFMH